MFEHVIRIPFDMRPVFKPCPKPSFNANETDLEIQAQKVIELNNLGKDVWFETPTAIEEKLVYDTAKKLGLFNQHDKQNSLIECDNIASKGADYGIDVRSENNIRIRAENANNGNPTG